MLCTIFKMCVMFQQNTLTYLPISMYGGFYNGFNNRQSIAKLRRSAELRVSPNDMKCILNVITYVYCTRHSPLKILLQQCTMYPEYRRSVITCYLWNQLVVVRHFRYSTHWEFLINQNSTSSWRKRLFNFYI